MLQFHFRDCRIQVHFSIFVLLAFCSLFAGFQNGLFLILCILLHEAGHLAMMFRFGREPQRIVVSGLGLRIQLPCQKSLSYRENILISLAGPAVNLVLGLLCFLAGKTEWAFASTALGAVHLLPIEPLDGGLALRAFLSEKFGTEKGRKITLVASFSLLLPMLVLGFMMLLQSRNNFSLLVLSIYLMLYLVLKKDFFMAF